MTPLRLAHHSSLLLPSRPRPPPPVAVRRAPPISACFGRDFSVCFRKVLLGGVAGVLSLSLVTLPPLTAAAATEGSPPVPPQPGPSEELCREDEAEALAVAEVPPESVTNDELVEEAWEVVNESYLPDAGRRPWSPEKWMEVKQQLPSKIQTRSRAHDVIKKMLGSLGDTYTRFLPPEEFSKMAKYDVTGIGINLREVPDDKGAVRLKVLGIILDGPAHAAGVRQGDELLSVNGMDVRGKSAFDVSSMLQGPNETFVTVEVKHGNCGPVQLIKVQRQLVARSPVFYRLEKLQSGDISVGYVHVKEFNALAKKDLLIALQRLQDAGASYFVLDLKDNLGGLVQAGIEVAKIFMDKGETVIHTVGRDPEVQKSIVAETAPLMTKPLIVLVNNRTASASEIVATALHDNCKAVLVGDKTYGKGLIQSVYELHDGSGVVVTIGKYVTPHFRDINGNGIIPDFSRVPALDEVNNYFSRCKIPSQS